MPAGPGRHASSQLLRSPKDWQRFELVVQAAGETFNLALDVRESPRQNARSVYDHNGACAWSDRQSGAIVGCREEERDNGLPTAVFALLKAASRRDASASVNSPTLSSTGAVPRNDAILLFTKKSRSHPGAGSVVNHLRSDLIRLVSLSPSNFPNSDMAAAQAAHADTHLVQAFGV
jgi:hypothetical protein